MILFILLVGGMSVIRVTAQTSPVILNFILQPPFSPYFEDYFDYEFKSMLILSGMANPATGDYEIYLKGSIEGNNGVTIHTQSGFRPSAPVIVPNGGSVMLTGADLGPYFSIENLEVSGISLMQLAFGDGLPEGVYTVCMQAFDYYTDLPLSGDYPAGCSSGLIIQHVEPPQIMTPFNEQFLVPTDPPQLIISWTSPAGAPLGTLYELSIAEVFEGMDPNEAIEGLLSPPHLETSTLQTTYLYSIADPVLEPGSQYVVQVQATDPNGMTLFRNEGKSEVVMFQYGEKPVSEEPADSLKTKKGKEKLTP